MELGLPASTYTIVRWVHILAGAAWFGEVITINFVLVPAVSRLSPKDQTQLLVRIFPRLFRLASVLSLIAVTAGIALLFLRYGMEWGPLFTTTTGRATLVGAIMGLALTTFHFVLEPRLDGMICAADESQDFEVTERIVRLLRIVPRGGLAVIGSVVILMMVGARGI